MTMMTATYTKLRDGSWGLKVNGKAFDGMDVIVTKKSGERVEENCGKVIWTDGQTSICRTFASECRSYQNRKNGRSGGSSSGKFECQECGDYVFRGSRCWETGCTH